MTDEEREYAHARADFFGFHVEKAQRLIDATTALRAKAVAELDEAKDYISTMTPVWAHGENYASAAALAELWEKLGVANQTAAMQRLEELLRASA